MPPSSCLVRPARGIDESVPTDEQWHRVLLDQLSAPVRGLRPAVFDLSLARRLDEMRRFRQTFRHMYFFDLDWERVAPLLDAAPALWDEVDAALHSLFVTLTEEP